MLVEPGFEGREVEDEAGDDNGRVVDVRDLDYAFAVGGSESVDGGADPVTRLAGSVDVVDHDDGAGRGECVEGSHIAASDLLEDLVTLVEFCAGHCCEAPVRNGAGRRWPARRDIRAGGRMFPVAGPEGSIVPADRSCCKRSESRRTTRRDARGNRSRRVRGSR